MDGATLPQTPSQTVGPFFHDELIVEGGNVLVREGARGERIRLSGRVLDGEGAPVPDAMLEIWQPDANGIYGHPNDPGAKNADENFRGFGRAATDDDGVYWFETVKPGAPAGEPDHGHAPFIGVRVFARGLLTHAVTRIYFDDEANDDDPALARVAAERRASLLARREHERVDARYHFDIRLQGSHETVFFDV